MGYKCLKCDNDKYIDKTLILPEKKNMYKVGICVYYAKICSECGYTELYSAKVVDKEPEKNKKEEEYVKITT